MNQETPTGREAGFTLMEMVVAVLIVSIMITVVAPHLMNAGKRAESTACEQNQRTIRAALSEYDLLYHTYPSGNTAQRLDALVQANILASQPKEPSGGNYVINDTDGNNVAVSCEVHGQLGAP
jgi:type II secretion system protein G